MQNSQDSGKLARSKSGRDANIIEFNRKYNRQQSVFTACISRPFDEVNYRLFLVASSRSLIIMNGSSLAHNIPSHRTRVIILLGKPIKLLILAVTLAHCEIFNPRLNRQGLSEKTFHWATNCDASFDRAPENHSPLCQEFM